MNVKEKIELISRNTVEIIKEEELKKLLETKKSPAVYCGYEPSGEVHLGHMVTALKLIDLEKAGCKVKVLFADWHAWLNKKGDWKTINENVKLWSKAFKKIGLKKADYVVGSSFQRKTQYIEDILTLSLHTTINRGLRSMQEIARDVENASISQAIYPLMQVADIKHLGLDIAQSGIEQRKIHMLARENMQFINHKAPVLVHTPLINSLSGPGKKMSSSEPNSFISVRDKPEVIKKKLSKAFCTEGVTENNPVLEITKLIVFPTSGMLEVKRAEKFGGNIKFNSYQELETAFAKKELHPMDLKNALATSLTEILAPIRKVFS